MSELTLHTVLEPMGPAGAIVLDDEQVAALSDAKAFPVVVTIGDRSARLRLARMGGKNLIGFSKAVRAEMGVDLGDEFDVPDVLAAALDADPVARAAFEGLSYTRRKEIARSIAEAKQDATRQRRLEKALAELRTAV